MKKVRVAKITLFLLPLVLVTILAAGCGGALVTEPPAGASLAGEQTEQLEKTVEVRGGGRVTVEIKDMKLKPAELNIKTGTIITWVNNDTVEHQLKAEGEVFKSPVLKPGDQWSFALSNIGDYPYSCVLHPEVKGVIHVKF